MQAQAYQQQVQGILMQKENISLQLVELKKALEEHPDYPDINNLMGVALSLSGRYKEAENYFKKALKLNPQ